MKFEKLRTGNVSDGKFTCGGSCETLDRCIPLWNNGQPVWNWCGNCIPGQVYADLSAVYDQLYLSAGAWKNVDRLCAGGKI